MTVDLSDLPKTIRLAVGDCVEIAMPSYSGSGNAWSATQMSGGKVVSLSVGPKEAPQTQVVRRGGTTEPPPLSLVPERVVISALAPGEAVWQLVLARPFDRAGPTARHEVRITVVGAPDRGI